MADIVSRQKRSQMMAGIKSKDTKPEIIVRKELHRRGFRFRLHRRDLPGRPDIVLSKFNVAVLVNGCFWHGHSCSLFRWPKTRVEFWREKILENTRRDERNVLDLKEKGWRTAIVWECALKGRHALGPQACANRLCDWMITESRSISISEDFQG